MDEKGICKNPMEVDYPKDIPAVQTHNREESSHEKTETDVKTSHEMETNDSEQVTICKKEYNESDLTNNLDRAISDKASSCKTNTVEEVLEGVSMEIDRQETRGREAEVENDKEQEEISRSHEIKQISPVKSECVQCKKVTDCSYIYVDKSDKNRYLCTEMCISAYRLEHPGCTVTNKKYVIKEITRTKMTCSECEKEKYCYFYCHYDGEHTYYCSETCLESMMADEKDKYTYKRQRITVVEMEPKASTCFNCNATKPCTISFPRYGKRFYVCSMNCVKDIKNKEGRTFNVINCKKTRRAAAVSTQNPSQAAREERERTFIRSCMQCSSILTWESADVLTWETMDFCNKVCLEQYLNRTGGKCKKCHDTIQNTCLGKYCARFGDICHFCCTVCLEEFKKDVKICCYCQRDISKVHLAFVASVSDDDQFKDFCSKSCLEKLVRIRINPVPPPVWAKCVVCSLEKQTTIEIKVKNARQRLCSDPCFAAYKFVNNIFPDQCTWCKNYFERKQGKCFTIYEKTTISCFCSKSCMNVFISNSRLIVPCNWCKVKKYNFDMIKRTQPSGQAVMMCSLNCLSLYQVSVNAVSSRSLSPSPTPTLPPPAAGGQPESSPQHQLDQTNPSLVDDQSRNEPVSSPVDLSPSPTPTLPPPAAGGQPESSPQHQLDQTNPSLVDDQSTNEPVSSPVDLSPSPTPTLPPPAAGGQPESSPQHHIADCSSSFSYAWPVDISEMPLSFGLDQTNPSLVDDQSTNEPVSSPVDLSPSPTPTLPPPAAGGQPESSPQHQLDQTNPSLVDDQSTNEPVSSPVDLSPSPPPTLPPPAAGGQPESSPQHHIVDCSNSFSYAWPVDISEMPLSFGLDQTNPSLVDDQSRNEPVSSPVEFPTATLPEVEIEFIDYYGSENDSGGEGSDAEFSGLPMFVPRAQRVYLYPDEVPPLPVTLAADNGSAPPPGFLEPTDMFKFDWRPSPDPPLPPTDRREVFSKTRGGPTARYPTPYDAFVAIWNRQFMESIATETNRYAQELMEKQVREGSLKPSSRLNDWKDTNVDELYVYFALLVATGLCSKAELKEYWLQGDLLSTPNFTQHMTMKRFCLLAKCLHFARDSPRVASLSRSEAKLHKLDPVMKHLNCKFQSLYRLGRDVAIDDSLVQWKGWLDVEKYVENKVPSVGIKTCELYEAATGYLWRFIAHAGREEAAEREVTPVSGVAATLVLELLKGLQYRGHTVWMDYNYNSPALARVLKSLRFDCAGPMRTTRPLVPRRLAALTKAMMAVGQVEGYTSGDVDVLVWRGQARVGVVSTYHGAAVRTARGKTKPAAVHEYEACMGGLDKKDRILNAFSMERKRTRIWYKKMFNRLLNVSILNAHILHKRSSVPNTPVRLIEHRSFRRQLVAQLIERHETRPIVYASVAKAAKSRWKAVPALDPEVLKHFPAVYGGYRSGEEGKRSRPYCVLCRKRVRTCCPTCNVALCAFGCIKKYHQATNKDKEKATS